MYIKSLLLLSLLIGSTLAQEEPNAVEELNWYEWVFQVYSWKNALFASDSSSSFIKSVDTLYEQIAMWSTFTYDDIEEKTPVHMSEKVVELASTERHVRGLEKFNKCRRLWRSKKSCSKYLWPPSFNETLFWNRNLDFMDSTYLVKMCSTESSFLKYDYFERLGSGAGGDLFLGKERETNAPVAIKRFHISWSSVNITTHNIMKLLDTMTEMVISQSFDAPNLRKMKSCHISESGLVAAFEYIDGVTARHLVSKLPAMVEMGVYEPMLIYQLNNLARIEINAKPESWQLRMHIAATIVAGVLEALNVLHGHGIVHRDIKMDNILVTRDHQVRLIDYGLATSTLGKRIQHGAAGTAPYIAPESIPRAELKSDIYSIGVLVLQLMGAPITTIKTSRKRPMKLTRATRHPIQHRYLIGHGMNKFWNRQAWYRDGEKNEPHRRASTVHFDTMIYENEASVYWTLSMYPWPQDENTLIMLSFIKNCLGKSPASRLSVFELLKDDFIVKMAQRPSAFGQSLKALGFEFPLSSL